ncbi:T9SS type A sorting domain-containing protein [Winogradskyella pulchriflava]|uniref:T9SS type A sorting domain-containing protein n=1 Tax=Winogradskyella pulchriflava TaxID=1110688 RepID=A0ABV6QCE4_9FLAO
MKKKRTTHHGEIDHIHTKTIYLNVNHLEPGKYVLKITHKNKIVKTVKIIKKT